MTQPFSAWEYDAFSDQFHWVAYTRQALIDLCVRRAFEKRYGKLLREGAKIGDVYAVQIAGDQTHQPAARYDLVPQKRAMGVMMASLLRGVLATVLSSAEHAAIQAEWNEFWRGRKVEGLSLSQLA